MPFPYWHQLGLPITATEGEMVQHSLYQLELLLKQQSGPKDTAAIIVEPVLGEGGYVPAPSAFLQGLRGICDRNDILLIVDEVQCGFGRTGKYFYIENSGVKPDIMTVAKVRSNMMLTLRDADLQPQGLANGFPLSGVISRTELTDKLKPGCLVRYFIWHRLISIKGFIYRVVPMRAMPFLVQLPSPLPTSSKARGFLTMSMQGK
jgi:4-aminobutyrate aminotransferase